VFIDYGGTDKQVEGAVNAVLGVTLSGVYYVLRCLTDPSIPMNEGCFRPVEVNVPEGSVLNPKPPSAVAGGNVETSQRNVDVLLKAFAQIVPERVCAACQGTMNNVAVGGVDAKGEAWTFYETIAGGFGGRRGIDGLNAVHSHMTNTMNTPIEAIEAVFPIRFLKYKLRRDSGGAGRWRGGAGVERRWMLLAPKATVSVLAERTRIPPWGLLGGKTGSTGEFYVVKANGRRVKLESKSTVRLSKNDTFVAKTPGGGGYQKPEKRDPQRILRDVADEVVSLKAARRDYKILLKQHPQEPTGNPRGNITRVTRGR
jgi:N-methylhydantoinase B